ncbi:TIGR03747 family integrating conjugative element membrane protein [Pseudomonas huaxiensis]|uniref:TIGR03747 family integrating conjugative element membrane protein n=1 Tax=Pseudomonas huaxiensis TaxID=2213017 RepID=UPI000DA68859|nr:TIGR03747 family integrating conjugative element membrane protein [Pseudomonas huaxiensis]
MSDPADAARRQQTRQQGLIIALVTLPFRLFAVLAGSLLISLVIEWIGLVWLWPEQGWRHAQGMLEFELEQFSRDFARSVLIQEPGRTIGELVAWVQKRLVVDSALLTWSEQLRSASSAERHDLLTYVSQAYRYLEGFLLAGAYTLLVFLVRLSVLCLSVPLFFAAAFVGFIDGLVRRDIRRFGAGRESGFVYHRARATLLPLVVSPWVIYLALPVSVSPLLILLPAAVLLGIATNIAAASFKKYL